MRRSGQGFGLVFKARKPVGNVESFIACEEAPEADAVDDFDAGFVSVPPVVGVEPFGDFRVVQVVGVPELALTNGGVEAELEHIAHVFGVVGLGTVPDAVVNDKEGACIADDGNLTHKILVAGDVGF